MDLEVDGHATLVTAASSGLGRASAQSLARGGADVAICGRDQDRLEDATASLRDAGPGDVLPVQADLTDRPAVESLVDRVVDAFGGLDHLVTSAGGPPSTTFAETSEEEWYEAYDQLVMSVVWTVEAARPHLAASGHGSVVCITSRTVQEVADGLVLSNAVRRGVTGLAKTLSRELAPAIRVNEVRPGTIETPRIEELIEAGVTRGDFEDYEGGLTALSRDIPAGRIGDPEELGDVVAFLASPRASYVNGAAVPVDGGHLRS